MLKKLTTLKTECSLVAAFFLVVGALTSIELGNREYQFKLDVNYFSNEINLNSIEVQSMIDRYVSNFDGATNEVIANNIYHLENNLLFIQYLDGESVSSIDNSSGVSFNLAPPILQESQFKGNGTYSPTVISNNKFVQTTISNEIAISNTIAIPRELHDFEMLFIDCTQVECSDSKSTADYSEFVNKDLQIKVLNYKQILWLETINGLMYQYLLLLMTIVGLVALVRFQRNKMYQEQLKKDFERSHDLKLDVKNQYGLMQDLNTWNKPEQPIMVLIDPDNVSSIKSKHGEQAVTYLLEQTRNRLILLTADSDVYSTEQNQFVVLTTDRNLAENIHQVIGQPIKFREQMRFPTTSIGVAERAGSESTLKLMKSATIALWEAKKKKNSVHFYCEEINNRYQQQVDLEQSLSKAIQDNQITLNYQIQVNRDGLLHGIEALARWRHHRLGNITPDKFIPIAESAGLMPALGKLIYSKAIHDIKALSQQLNMRLPLSVNVSIREFMIENFAESLVEICEKSNFPTSDLMLEITETLEVEDRANFDKVANRLKSLGFKLSLDDFGTGYSSLKLLAELPLDEVKLDRSFVIQIDSQPKYSDIICSVVHIAKSLDLQIVSEGVETQSQFKILCELGCTNFQGYLFGYPVPIEHLSDSIIATTNKAKVQSITSKKDNAACV